MKNADSLINRGCARTVHGPAASTLVALAALMWIFAGSLLASDVGRVNKLALQCHSGRQRACAELAKMALENKDAAIRGAAVEKLIDQALLVRIAMEDADADVRNRAVQALTNQADLAKIALENKDAAIRSAAVEKLIDQTLLVRIAMEGADAGVRNRAVQALTNQAGLARVATEAPDAEVRADATRRLADQTVLNKLAAGDSDAGVRAAAGTRLAQLASMAKTAAAVARHVAAICVLLQQSGPSLVLGFAPGEYPVKISFDDSTGLVLVVAGSEAFGFSNTSEQFEIANLARIELDVGSGQSGSFVNDSSGRLLSSTSSPTQTANVRFVMKNDGAVLQIISLSCAKDQIERLQAEINQVNELIGANSEPAN